MMPHSPLTIAREALSSICALAFATFAFAAPQPCSAQPQSPPNVLFILADDVGREVLGCYGGVSYPTPRIDALAQQGVRCTHAYATPMCHPTRVTLLTGLYPPRLGEPEWATFPKHAEKRTLAHLFKHAGYATAISGKWQLNILQENLRHPHQLGFDDYCLFGYHEGPEYYQPRIWQNGRLRTDVADRYGPDVYCEFLIDFMRANRERPFLAFYSMALCHAVTNDLAEPPPVGPNGRYQSYGEMVTAMDERVGRVLDALDELGLADNTIVVFTSDNGTPPRSIIDAEDGKYIHEKVSSRLSDGRTIPGGKGQFTDWGIRVPLIVSWPPQILAGHVCDQLIDASDHMPTLAELAGLPLLDEPRALDGRSFARCLTDGEPGSRRWIFAYHDRRWAMRDARWKLYSDGRFFDADNDPYEQAPLNPAVLTAGASQSRAALEAAAHEINAASRKPSLSHSR